MCFTLIFIVLQVLTLECVTAHPYKDYILAYIPVKELAYLSSANIEAIPMSYYNNGFLHDPWHFQGMMPQNVWSPYRPYSPKVTTGPVSFGGQVKAKGAVSVVGGFGSQGCGTFTSYSAPPTPVIVTSEPALPYTTSLPTISSLPKDTTLPTITTLPAVNLPCAINVPFTVNMPSTISVPIMPMPVTMASVNTNGMESSITITSDLYVVGNSASDANVPVASPVKFSGTVPASGRVKIHANFC